LRVLAVASLEVVVEGFGGGGDVDVAVACFL
jgi:hypothetical protein